MNNEEMKIYLAGYINGKVIDKCVGWRKQVREYYENWKGKERYPIIWMDPLNGKEYEKISGDGLTAEVPPNSIIHRDYKCVVKADLIIANMDTFGEDRPLTGTICELAWAWEHHIPIIMISKEDRYIKHPFTAHFSSWTVGSVEEMLERRVVNYFFKGWHNAIN
jgi:hypothetical protein